MAWLVAGGGGDKDVARAIPWQDVLRRKIPGRVQKTRYAIQQPLALLQKVQHDLEQLDYILRARGSTETTAASTTSSPSFLLSFRRALTTLSRALPQMSRGMTTWDAFERELEAALPQEHRSALARGYGRILHLPPYRAAPSSAAALRASLDGRAIEETFFARGGLAVIDDVLSPAALQALQRHTAEAMIWHDPRESYVGAYGNSGLLTSTTVRVAAEIEGCSRG